VFEDQAISIPSSFESLCDLFESIEKGSADKLHKFMRKSEYKYEKGMKKFAHMPGLSFTEFMDPALIKDAFRLDLFRSHSKHIRRYFSDPKLIALMEFPVLFLGAMPQETPALYSLMNYAGLKLGTWYPEGGFGRVVEAMAEVAKMAGATFRYNTPVETLTEIGRAHV